MTAESHYLDSDEVARRFRARVFSPTEGVFLFHQRALERLVRDELEAKDVRATVPKLHYHLMSAADFLSGLESENPEALTVIEGLSLPNYVILLPLPRDQGLPQAAFDRLLRDYWARRFEAEIARAWQQARDDNGDEGRYGDEALQALIGTLAWAEVRDVLTRDGLVPSPVDDNALTRAFLAHITRLRYFAPGARGFCFPTVRDWPSLDSWLAESGLDLPPAAAQLRSPFLLKRARPDLGSGRPALDFPLPRDLPYPGRDPDGIPVAQSPALSANGPAEETQDLGQAAEEEADSTASGPSGVLRRTLRALGRPFRAFARSAPRDPAKSQDKAGPTFRISQHQVRRKIGLARQAEREGRHVAGLLHLARARKKLQRLESHSSSAVEELGLGIELEAKEIRDSLASELVNAWELHKESVQELQALIDRLAEDTCRRSVRSRPLRLLMQDIQQLLRESRITYYRLQPFSWLLTLGRSPMRQILPFQSSLKALRALEHAANRLEQLPWPNHDIERFALTLESISARIREGLQRDLAPTLDALLLQAGFVPKGHRERVAAVKLRSELLDTIVRRRHLKFTDVRDIVARNLLRLPGLQLKDLLTGDRLARFDRAAARALPGLYQAGEFYIKGLQQMSAPLFGTPVGRLVLRHLILPFGLAFLGLKTFDVMLAFVWDDWDPDDLDDFMPYLVAGLGLLSNLAFYTKLGRVIAWDSLRGIWWGLRLILLEGPSRFLRWRPILRLLRTRVLRALDRHLIKPAIVGSLLVGPFVIVGSLVEESPVKPGPTLIALVLAVGTLMGNTPTGRRFLDDAASTVGRFLRLVNQTLVIGLIRELIHLFKEITRRFEQGLHWIDEILSHQVGEHSLALVIKSLLAPIWRLLEAVIQFYVTVLVEPQVNPIKHFPLVTIGHKVMFPFLPMITGFMLDVLDAVLPKWISYPLVTLTVLLLPGLVGFLVWELKENWKLYASNHPPLSGPATDAAKAQYDPSATEPAIIGGHGETMRGFLRRGFHSGTLPKAFDRLRSVIRAQIADEQPQARRIRDARRHLLDVEQALCRFCDRELVESLRQRNRDPDCRLTEVRALRPHLATSTCELRVLLSAAIEKRDPIKLCIRIGLEEPELHLSVSTEGEMGQINDACWQLIRQDVLFFGGRAGAAHLDWAD